MSKVQLESNDTPDLIAGKMQSAIHAYKQAGGELPAQLEANPVDLDKLSSPAVTRILPAGTVIRASPSVEAGTIRIKPQGSIGV